MAKSGKKNKDKTASPEIVNRRARHDYQIEDTLEVGIALQGSEVKAIRDGKMSLAEGYVRAELDPPRLTLHSVHIGEYTHAHAENSHPAVRTRILLAHKREIRKLATLSQAKGVTIVPLKAYFKDGRLKVLIGLGRGKKQHDRREDVKRRDQEREMRRAMTRKRL